MDYVKGSVSVHREGQFTMVTYEEFFGRLVAELKEQDRKIAADAIIRLAVLVFGEDRNGKAALNTLAFRLGRHSPNAGNVAGVIPMTATCQKTC
jgi:hypothetical protein